jgi:hypothetical protein
VPPPNQDLHFRVAALDQEQPNQDLCFPEEALDWQGPNLELRFQVLEQVLPILQSGFRVQAPDQEDPNLCLHLLELVLPSPCYDFRALDPNLWFDSLALVLYLQFGSLQHPCPKLGWVELEAECLIDYLDLNVSKVQMEVNLRSLLRENSPLDFLS